MISYKGKLYQHETNSVFEGMFPVKDNTLEEVKQLELHWTGEFIPLDVWKSIIAFFRWGFSEFNSEQTVRLYYHKEKKEWKVWAFPQECRGLAVREIKNEDYTRQLEAIGEGFLPMGSVHHHCNISAFQSGTDNDDEVDSDGLHITVGQLDKQQLDIHGRVVFRKTFYPVEWCDWFDVAEWVKEVDNIPWELYNDIVKFNLVLVDTKDVLFPNEWKENIVIPTYSSDNRNQRQLFDNDRKRTHRRDREFILESISQWLYDCGFDMEEFKEHYLRGHIQGQECSCSEIKEEMEHEHISISELEQYMISLSFDTKPEFYF